MADGNDLGKIVSLIMENPRLIEEISNLGKRSDAQSEQKESERASANTPGDAQSFDQKSTSQEKKAGGKNRSQLLGALKPYVSEERAQAIDSMLSIVEILDAMKGRP